MLNRILIALGIRKKPVPDTFVLASANLVDDGLGNMVSPELIKRRKDRVFIGKGHLYINGVKHNGQYPPAPMPSKPRAQKDKVALNQAYGNMGTRPIDQDMFTNAMLAQALTASNSPPCETFAGKGGEFSGAGASGSWDSPSSSSSDTSSSSSDSGSSSSSSSD